MKTEAFRTQPSALVPFIPLFTLLEDEIIKLITGLQSAFYNDRKGLLKDFISRVLIGFESNPHAL